MLPRVLFLLCIGMALGAEMSSAWASKRHAFVVGIQDYQHPKLSKLRTAKADAEAMGERLATFGYAVERAIDVTSAEFQSRWGRFLATVAEDDVVVVFFASHGIEVSDRNYLLLKDAAPVAAGRSPTEYGLVDADQLLKDIQNRKPTATILILDACRDDPWQLGHPSNPLPGGLAPMVPPPGSFILFSASAFEQALDYIKDPIIERNSPFTAALLSQVSRYDVRISQLAEEVRTAVWKATTEVGRKQSPAFYDQLQGSLCIPGDCVPSKIEITADEAASRCKELAGLHLIRDEMVEGVDRYVLDPFIAVPACVLAVEQNPQDNQLKLMLARAYGKAGRFDRATPIYLSLALAGEPEAMAQFGYALVHGQGLDKNPSKGLKWIRAASKAGNASGYHYLGNAYRSGYGIPAAPAESIKWYKLAKSAGLPLAWVALGGAYINGRGVPVDRERGLAFYKEAADFGTIEAIGNIGWAYMNGYGVRKDPAAALLYLRRAADLGAPAAISNIGWLYQKGELGDRPNHDAARKWYRKAYRFHNHPDSGISARGLGLLAEQRKEYQLARTYYQEAIRRRNDSHAYVNLGFLLRHGRGGERSEVADIQSCDFFKEASARGNVRGMVAYGFCLQTGRGAAIDAQGAADLYRKSASLGNAQAMNNLGNLFLYGRGVSKNETQALFLLQKSRETGNGFASYNLARLYHFGISVRRDRKVADRLYQEAAGRGHLPSIKFLCIRALRNALAERPASFSWCDKIELSSAATGLKKLAIGIKHLKGLGLKKSSKKAEQKLREAEAAGEGAAKCFLSEIIDRRSQTDLETFEAAVLFLGCWRDGGTFLVQPNRFEGSYLLRKKLQEILKLQGHYKGAIDGIFGERTYRALDEARMANAAGAAQSGAQ